MQRVKDEAEKAKTTVAVPQAYVSVNKALVTQASAAIPVVPLYISILYKVMKEKGIEDAVLAVKMINEQYGKIIYMLDI